MPSEPFIGEIYMFAGNFPPRSFALCDGQLLSIAQNTALFSIIGTMYGGNGQTTFGLPDLRGRAPVHWGTGPGLTERMIGQAYGQETVTLTPAEMPAHNHLVSCQTEGGSTQSPANGFPAADRTGNAMAYSGETNGTMHSGMIGIGGGSQAHTNLPPSLPVSFIIALEGIFPPRN